MSKGTATARYRIERKRGHDYVVKRYGDGKIMAYARNRALAEKQLKMIVEADTLRAATDH